MEKMGFGFFVRGICQNCNNVDLRLDRTRTDAGIEMRVRCIHESACKRIAELSAKDRQEPDIIKKE